MNPVNPQYIKMSSLLKKNYFKKHIIFRIIFIHKLILKNTVQRCMSAARKTPQVLVWVLTRV